MAPLGTQADSHQPDSKTIRSFFQSISSQYDFLNSLMSFGLDRYWRKQAVQKTLTGREESILGLGVGTGKSLFAFLEAKPFQRAVGCDFSIGMLSVAKERFAIHNGNLGSAKPAPRTAVHLVACDFHELPFVQDTFDVVTGSFMLRSVRQRDHFFKEILRVLKRGGKAVFLELTRPKNRFFWNGVYRPYLRFYVPTVGAFFSKQAEAYQFLSQSIQSFEEPVDLKRRMESNGFSKVFDTPLTLGTTTIMGGYKP